VTGSQVNRTRYVITAALASVAPVLSGCSADVSEPAATDTSATDVEVLDAADSSEATVASGRSAASQFVCPETQSFDGLATVADGKRLRVITTVAPITSIAANIAGEFADVVGVIPEGTNSHTYEPTPSVAQALSNADLVLVNGLKLEEPTKDLALANLPKGAQIIELGTRTLSEDQYIYDFSFPREGGKPNPHLWTNPPMASCYAAIAANAMAAADPANAENYQANASKYRERLADLDTRFRQASDTVPTANRKLLTYHDAYAYFAQTYGWEVLGAVQVSDFEDPTPKEVVRLITQVRKTGVPAIFGSEIFPSSVLKQIAKEARVRFVDVLRDDDLPGAPGSPNHSFLGLLKYDYEVIVESLGGRPDVLKEFDPADIAPDRAVYPQ
jgi:ABC-type Zn uptake system ZnuABC Zn-binding protein ZnuA